MTENLNPQAGRKYRVRRAGRETFIHVLAIETVGDREMVRFVPVRGTRTRMAPVTSFTFLEDRTEGGQA